MKVLQVVGYKNAGKTTLVCEIVGMLAAEGLRVGTLKHDAHDIDPEPEDADTRRHREAGAFMTGLASAARTAWVCEQPSTLDDMLDRMSRTGADGVIVEGFKAASYPKLVLLRGPDDLDLLALPGVIAVALRGSLPDGNESVDLNMTALRSCPLFDTNDRQFGSLLQFVQEWFVRSAKQ